MQRSRLNRDQKEVPIKTKSTGSLPRPADQSTDPDGSSACKTEQGAGDDEYLPAEEELITGSYLWDGWDTAGLTEGQYGTAWPSEMHQE